MKIKYKNTKIQNKIKWRQKKKNYLKIYFPYIWNWILITNYLHPIFTRHKYFPHLNDSNTLVNFVKFGKSLVNLSIMRHNWFWPIGIVVTRTSLENLHLGLDCKNSRCGLGLSIGQEVGQWWTSFLKITITSATR
jgi:hypothetical protein